MWITGIDHVQLAMPAGGEDQARAFYFGLLGIPEVPKPQELEARGGVWFESEHVRLHLGTETPFRPAMKAHPALVADDLSEIENHLRDAGLAISGDRLAGYRRIYVSDPFGNRLELMEPRVTTSELAQTITRMEHRCRQSRDERHVQFLAAYDALCGRFASDLKSEREGLLSRGGALMLIQELIG